MAKVSGIIGITIGVMALLAVPLIYLVSASDEEVEIMDREFSLPPIDTTGPAETELATFAMG
jgi:hypothetical protein